MVAVLVRGEEPAMVAAGRQQTLGPGLEQKGLGFSHWAHAHAQVWSTS